ncbi:GH36-type glycosyl hydrolase domain-containing protein [Lutispora thermophila]|uniref:Cyclic beta-1,2-glucan synthetase n=1 Tax=Lutispora thermophila DSM 19022 TaxID=1122184 RepID=A0A1M6CDK9_9FIRM|nr:glucoamylase family protein [Lutispora thermophila]SHI58901.1 cyclic beta-1,2-glucan synthetase [Lutispora thermophila DSM 19022]
MNDIDMIKDVILSKEDLLDHGYHLGQKHILKKRKTSTRMLKKRLMENYQAILEIYKELDRLAKENKDMAPASDWLLDNFYKIEEQVKDVMLNIQQERYYRLNTLASGYLMGYPRVYALVLEYFSHTDGSMDTSLFIDFIKAYQTVQILSISEVWALALMTRIGLVENIKIICNDVFKAQIQWNKGEEHIKLKRDELLNAIDNNFEIEGRLNTSYLEHLLALLRRTGSEHGEILDYIEGKLEEYNTNIQDLVQYEHKKYAVRKVSIGNSITSLHAISTLDWNYIFESICVVEEMLSKDPANIYTSMDFESRDYYRKIISEISGKHGISETKVANGAVNLSKKAMKLNEPFKKTHVGYYLIDEGRKELYQELNIKSEEIRLKSMKPYLASVVSFSVLYIILTVCLLGKGLRFGDIVLLCTLLLIPASEIGVSLTNYVFMKLYKPTFLPRLEFAHGIPDESKTIVIIPALLSSKNAAMELIEKMEVYYLANKDKNLFFGLIGDFKDSDRENNPEDESIVEAAMEGVKILNEKYKEGRTIFYYFHRKREFNDKQNKWMGWERKRGAIVQFNDLLSGRESNSFVYKSSGVDELKDIKYVITIDSDTNLIMESAAKLIGTIEHPLNKPVYDKERGIVTEGYGIIQPRIGVDVEDSNKTLFSQIFAGDGGIEPYTTAVSNIYQDVFGEGIFTGKGIYDLSMFNEVTKEKIEDNTILSHDLLEGSLLRTGLAGDIELIDGFPGKYLSHASRQHRWTRGDWQLIKWITGKNPLTSLSRWKMVDNLRRSMIQPSIYLLLLLGILCLPCSVMKLILVPIFLFLFPNLLWLISIIERKSKDTRQYMQLLKKTVYQLFFLMAFLPYNAYMMMDAAIRSLYRVFYSHRNMLEWVTAADAEKKLKSDLKGYYIKSKCTIVLTLIFAVVVTIKQVFDVAAAILLGLWILSPYIAYKASEDVKTQKPALTDEDRENIQRIGRKTWAYYEELVREEFNYLPPDNYQEYPPKGAAPRTSPTNIGLYLVSTLAAADLGYINAIQMLERVENTLNTIEKLDNWKGHLYNWYDIRTLEVLRPLYVSTVDSGNFISYLILLMQGLEDYIDKIDNPEKIKDIISRIEVIIERTEFIHLYDKNKNLFSIGYDVEKEKLTNSYYDLLASEARTTSYVATARREVPLRHWRKLGRALTCIGKNRTLVSWTGTMFEYFMPALIMRKFDNTIFDETYKGVLQAQKEYGNRNNVPWGTSESGYYTFDLDLNYQYKAFGVPDLGLKRGLIEDVVISPYSTVMTVNFDPKGASKNLKKLIELGLEGKYGLYEAVDFTVKRIPMESKFQIIKSYMAHHQGMSLLAICNFLKDDIMIRRFHSHPLIKAGEVLLQERIPENIIITKEYKETSQDINRQKNLYKEGVRNYSSVEVLPPPCQILTNGRYSVLLNNRGGGYSKLDGILINRWRNDAIEGGYGNYIFVRNITTDKVWSTTWEPFNDDPDGYNVAFYQSRAEFIRIDDDIKTVTEVFISPEDNVEIRRVKIENHGKEPVTLEVTSYIEVVLTTEAADIAHRAFSNLFVRTEYLEEYNSIMAVRKPREGHGQEWWAFHSSLTDDSGLENVEYETNRANFIGRGRDIAKPIALCQSLTNSSGTVLDPIMSIRRVIKIKAGGHGEVSFVTGCANSKEEIREMIAKYQEASAIDRAYALAITRSQVEGAYLNLDANDIVGFEKLIGHLVYGSPTRTLHKEYIIKNKKGQPSLWPFGISGDLPIMLISISDERDIPILKQAIKAHEFLRIKGFIMDLVILNMDESSYLQPLRTAITNAVEGSHGKHLIGRPGGVSIVNAVNISQEDKELLIAASTLVFKAEAGSIEKQLVDIEIKRKKRRNTIDLLNNKKSDIPRLKNLLLFNGYGGFSPDGSEYIMNLKKDLNTPAPWINVVSNPNFGFIISERGGGYVWAENSREYKLTSWTNDPISDKPQEKIYLKDDEMGIIWSFSPESEENMETWTVTHGWGYTILNKDCNGLSQQLEMFVPWKEKIKISMLRLKNKDGRKRTLRLCYYMEPVLGVSPKETKQHIIVGYDSDIDGLIMKNGYNIDFPGRLAYMSSSEPIIEYKTNKLEFLDLLEEASEIDLSIGYEPCGAIEIEITLGPEEEKVMAFYLGQSNSYSDIKNIMDKYKDVSVVEAELENVKRNWRDMTGRISVETPDKSMDIMLNGWLIYQTIACRLWGRSGFYQSGGAFGFRDQLQDAMNIGMIMPELLKQQILLHCSHQFEEGDVLHWWHPVTEEKGVRTRFSDDLLWLPYGVIQYIRYTEDRSILDIEIPYVKAEPLKEGEDERYGVIQKSSMTGTVYEHCVKAIDRSLNFGDHKLPLMGSGDWNDGMNLVGNKGKGESVWLAFFLYEILMDFVPICEYRQDIERMAQYKKTMENIKEAIEENAWDGQWYRRAYFDDGTPLGSSENKECMIDSIAQSWSVMSGAASPERAAMAMESVKRHLVKEEESMVLLFTPPFDKTNHNPGYIKSYVPGVRENGGQYTHGAVWTICAFAQMGDGNMAYKIFHMINPINHARTPIECSLYKVEPYAVAADVYSANQHVGRGGWSWYTGAAGWLYKAGIEYILGIKIRGKRLVIDPCIPTYWEGYKVVYNHFGTIYNIMISNPSNISKGVLSITLDGNAIVGNSIEIADDKNIHQVNVIMGC